jgi:hypothetical protein
MPEVLQEVFALQHVIRCMYPNSNCLGHHA